MARICQFPDVKGCCYMCCPCPNSHASRSYWDSHSCGRSEMLLMLWIMGKKSIVPRTTNSLSNHVCPTRLLHCCWSVELKSIPEIIVDRYGGLIFWLAMLCSMFCVPSSSAVFLSSFLAVICPVALDSPAFLIICQTVAVATQGCSRVVIIEKQNYIQFKQDAAVLPILLNPFRKNSSSVLFSHPLHVGLL